MSFAHPSVLLLLWLVPLFAAGAAFRARARERKLAALTGAERARALSRGLRRAVRGTLLTLAACGLVIAAARPQWGEREQARWTSSRNLLVVLDVSRSMLAEDVRPNRLERAKADLADLVRDLREDRAGLLVFRHGATVLCPFTTDRSFFRQALDGVSVDSASRGETDLGGALEAALAAFDGLGTDHNAILLLSDGEDLSGHAEAVAGKCAEAGIPIFCVGIGESDGATVPSGDGGALTYKGEEVRSKLEARTLVAIAEKTGGVYLPMASLAAGANTLGTIYNRHVKTLVERERTRDLERRKIERYPVFLLPALLCLLAAAALSDGRPAKARIPRSH